MTHRLESWQMTRSDHIKTGFQPILFMDFGDPVERFFKAVVETEAEDMGLVPGQKMIKIEAQGGEGGGFEEGSSVHGSDDLADLMFMLV